MCAGTWGWMVNFNWRNLKQFLQEKAGSVFPMCDGNMSDTQ